MRIKLSQSDWQRIGEEMGWIKVAFDPNRGGPGRAEPMLGRGPVYSHLKKLIERLKSEGKDTSGVEQTARKDDQIWNKVKELLSKLPRNYRYMEYDEFSDEEKKTIHEIEKMFAWINGGNINSNGWWPAIVAFDDTPREKREEYERIFTESRDAHYPREGDKLEMPSLRKRLEVSTYGTMKDPEVERHLSQNTPFMNMERDKELIKFKNRFKKIRGRYPTEAEIKNFIKSKFTEMF
jgi:hypothetical protein